MRNLPQGLTEIYLHPATGPLLQVPRPGYRYREELEALTSPEIIAACRIRRGRLGGFTDFVGPTGARALRRAPAVPQETALS